MIRHGEHGERLLVKVHDPVLPMNAEAREAGGTEIIKERIRPFFEKCTRLSA